MSGRGNVFREVSDGEVSVQGMSVGEQCKMSRGGFILFSASLVHFSFPSYRNQSLKNTIRKDREERWKVFSGVVF